MLFRYSGFRSIALSELAPALVEQEQGASYAASRDAIERMLLEPSQLPSEDSSIFITLIGADKPGVITMTLPDDVGMCVPVFSSSLRAVDYVALCLPRWTGVRYLTSSAVGLHKLLTDLRRVGTEVMALDRCPRCTTFMSAGTESFATPRDLLKLRAIVKATEMARLDLYLRYAIKSAQDGLFEMARQIAFETIAHVCPDDPRPHLLLGQLAVASGDDALLRDAKGFLRLLKLDAWERRLDEDAASGSVDFRPPETDRSTDGV